MKIDVVCGYGGDVTQIEIDESGAIFQRIMLTKTSNEPKKFELDIWVKETNGELNEHEDAIMRAFLAMFFSFSCYETEYYPKENGEEKYTAKEVYQKLGLLFHLKNFPTSRIMNNNETLEIDFEGEMQELMQLVLDCIQQFQKILKNQHELFIRLCLFWVYSDYFDNAAILQLRILNSQLMSEKDWCIADETQKSHLHQFCKYVGAKKQSMCLFPYDRQTFKTEFDEWFKKHNAAQVQWLIQTLLKLGVGYLGVGLVFFWLNAVFVSSEHEENCVQNFHGPYCVNFYPWAHDRSLEGAIDVARAVYTMRK